MKLSLEELKVKSFVTKKKSHDLRAGAQNAVEIGQNSRDECSPLCMPTFWKGCE